jgi:glycine cleavage system aminomethyltransferase T/glycine/D-amino acid oxidase-like deaminating enzyme
MEKSGQIPSRARVVVIGGGVGGASVAYHLAERGEQDVLLVDRSELTSGSTFHSAGLVGQLRSDPTLTRMNMYSVELYTRLQAETGALGWLPTGGIKLASSQERMEEIRRQIGWARLYDLPLHEISADEAKAMFPLISTDRVVGGAYLESDGHLDPSQLCYALAAGARARGVRIAQQVRVLGVDTRAVRGGRQVTRVRTDAGDVECEIVVNCAGMFAAEIARMVGVRVPLVPMSHQYLVTEPIDGLDFTSTLPSLRDPDLLVYYRQEVHGLLMGGYERTSRPWSASATSLDDIPADFNARLLPEDWPRFEEILQNSTLRVPAMAEVGLRRMINGPEAFTPDNEFILGESSVGGFFVAAGFCAHGIAGAGGIGKVMAEWILDGQPSMDVWHMDIRRFGPHYESPGYTMARIRENYETYYDIAYPSRERQSGRPLRTSAAYEWHATHGAVFGEKAGWERVNYYAPHETLGDESLRPVGWAGRDWSAAVAVEHHATRTTAGLFDESSFAKLEVSGPDAAGLLEWVCANRVAREVDAVTYTQMLNVRGGIEADVTVTRTGDDEFLVMTGTAFGAHDFGWLTKQARLRNATVRVCDVTGARSCFALWGPNAAAIVATMTATDVSGQKFMTSRLVTVADVPVRASRVTFTGEFGWELSASTEYGARLWSALVDAGAEFGLRPAGYRAIESLRLEKGYRVWGSDLTPETTPYEAGLGFCVKLDKPGGFLGLEALVAQREVGITRRLTRLTLADPRVVVLGGEPVRVGETVLGRVTSGGYGYTLAESIAYAYLPVGVEGVVDIDLFGTWYPATAVR